MTDTTSTCKPFLADVLTEIEIYEALLTSFNQSPEPDEELRRTYQARLASLRHTLANLDSSQSPISISSKPSSQQGGEVDKRPTPDGGKKFSGTTLAYDIDAAVSSDKDADVKTQPKSLVLPHGARVSAASPRAGEVPLPARKRPLSGNQYQSLPKARRASPSPHASAPMSPGSTSEFEDVLGALLGSDIKKELKEYEKEQQLWDARREQEREDAELARSMQESLDTTTYFPPDASSLPSMQVPLGPSRSLSNSMLFPARLATKAEASRSSEPGNANPERLQSLPAYLSRQFGARDESGGDDNHSGNSSIEEISQTTFMRSVQPEPISTDSNVRSSLRNPSTMDTPQYDGSSVYTMTGSSLSTECGVSPYCGTSRTYPEISDYASSFSKTSNYLSPPFESMGDLYSGGIAASSRPDDLYAVYHDPAKTQKELKSLLSNIRPDEDAQVGTGEITPEGMKCNLMEHQKLGLAWMKQMEASPSKGGILADDMGLGKTVQALALIVSRKSKDLTCKTTLIVAPVALMGQWAREISKLLKRGKHALSVKILHGNSRDLPWSKLREEDVILTTYGTLTSEIKRKHLWEEKLKRQPEATPSRPSEHIPLLGDKSKWYRVILDEAQWIKNKSAKASLAAWRLHAKHRWCLTGTPMQNSIDELYSLIRFLQIAPYKSWEAFNRDFARPLKAKTSYGSSKDNTMQQLQALCKAIMLRRTKYSKIGGQPILQLPEKTIEHQRATFSKDERDFYRALEGRAQITFNRYVEAGTVGRNYSNALVLLLRLRQACCHPHLIKDLKLETGAGPEPNDKIANARLLVPNVVERIKQVEAFECPICFDAAMNSLLFVPCGHPSCHECFDRLATQAATNADNEVGSVILCPSCRTKIDPAKLTDFNSFKTAFGSNSGDNEEGALNELLTNTADQISESDSGSESSERGDDIDDINSLANFVVPDESDSGHGSVQVPRISKPESKQKGKGRASSNKHLSLAQLRKEGLKNKAAKKRYLRRLEKKFQTSAKIDKAIETLSSIQAGGTNEKTIIFSQFTSLLDLLEVPLFRTGVQYKRYDGSMKRGDREEAVAVFTDDPQCTVLLVSLKAGSSGLNLTAASQVIIFDPHWNWYTEAQAIDRAHRIGQMRPVKVHRLLVPDTVEDRILALQQTKKELIETALDENASKNVGRLGVRELGYLFGVNSL